MKIEISGFDPDAIMRNIESKLEARVREVVRAVRCSEHGQSPTVRRKHTQNSEPQWSVEGCCEPLIQTATERIRATFR